ncbi:MAG: TspO/MBR family protein [Christensenellales bacterium]|jgi:benzodiazapine receptor
MTRQKVKHVVLIGVVVLAVAVLGSVFTDTDSAWYAGLTKADIQPPDWVFPVVWSAIYICGGLSAYFLTQARGERKKLVLLLYGLSAALNPLWNYVFFQLRETATALLLLAIIWITAGIMILGARRVSSKASWLVFPYFLWTGFALVLNYTIVMLN